MTTHDAQARPLMSAAPPAGHRAAATAAPFALSRAQILRSLLLIAAAALLAVAADIVLLRAHPGVYYVDVGNFRDKYFLDDAHRQEAAEDGTYRWTQASSFLSLAEVGVVRHALLHLDLGGRPEPAALTLLLNGQPWTGFTAGSAPRRYTLLLPPDMPDSLQVEIRSPTFQVPGDPRRLGVKVDGFGVAFLRDVLPLPLREHALAQVGALALLQVTALRMGWGWRRQALLLAATALGLAAALAGELLLAHAYMPRLAAAALALALLTWLGLPLVERAAAREEARDPACPAWGGVREVRLLWALMLVAVALRLVAVLYPTFGGQDLGRNIHRFVLTNSGQLVIIAPSGEFARGLTIYPPGPYLALMPLGLLTEDLGSILQGSLALMDGVTALLVGLLARRLGGGDTAGRLALALYAGNIAAFGAMSYSFSAQIFGQWFTAPMLLLLLAARGMPEARTWLLVYVLMAFQLLSHIGVAFLAVAWLGLTLFLLTVAWRRVSWWGWAGYTLTCVLSFVLLYIFILDETLAHASREVLPGEAGVLFPGYRILLVNGLRIGYSDVGLALLPLGLALVWRRARRAYRAGERREMALQYLAAPIAALLTLLFYLLVDLLLNVQVRYFYFALPLVLAVIGVTLGEIAARGRLARLAAWALALAVLAPQVAQWFSATFGEGKIPMTPLTH
ncbi:MAG TPA: hypothetical protein VNL77_06325 [Roseiflexaceae bacterium]|nr:hypothetical protein [Roseiflexaceae bacterium]